ncbi:MAG: hypothetical protein M1828_000541 [Chrysothrix sp. TS-e1954]|nr:MAG: hypothetical protein M1828_000541 [Chrysothrix sp. TS-e1954]
MGIDPSKKLSITVVGGSLGGLCTALALKRLGHDTTILERNPSPHLQNQGAGIVAGGDTLGFFNRYDRCQRPIACTSQCRMYLDKSGEIVHREDMVQNMTSWDLAYYLLRANYDGLKSSYCSVPVVDEKDGSARHLHGHTVTGFQDNPGFDKVRIQFCAADGEEGEMASDMLVGADGPSSTVRKILLPDVKRDFAGYCALRGTVPEQEASDEARQVFQERFTFFHDEGIQILAYLIPGVGGSVEPGQRLINFVWYKNFPNHSEEFEELMTDVDGVKHHITMPPGKISQGCWSKQVKFAEERMPPQFAEIISKTRMPFAQAITDTIAPRNDFDGGRTFLIGDALAGFRPHTVASTSQAAFDAMTLADMVEGKLTRKEFLNETMKFARLVQKRGVDMGNRSQFGQEPLSAHIKDRNIASTPREMEHYPHWVTVDL